MRLGPAGRAARRVAALVPLALALAMLAPMAPLLPLREAAAQQGIVPPQGGQARLRADTIRYDAKNKTFEARGNVVLQIGETTITGAVLIYHETTSVAWVEGGAKVVQGQTTLTAPSFRYEVTPQITHAAGGVTVIQPDLTLRSQSLRYQSKEQIAFAETNVELVTKDSRLTGPNLWANLAEKRGEVKGPSRLVRKGGPPPAGREQDRVMVALAKEDTTITAERLMTFAWAKTTEATAEGNVRIDQVDKKARGETAVYSEARDRIELVGSVRLDQVSGQWLVRERLAGEPKTEEERKALESPAVVTGDRVVITMSTRNSVVTGNVRITQAGRSAVGDRAEYDDATGKIVLTGRRARMDRDDGSWLEARTVVVSLKEDTFEAFGEVETTFSIKP